MLIRFRHRRGICSSPARCLRSHRRPTVRALAAPRSTSTITAGPSRVTTETTATFTFEANERATLTCSLDGQRAAPCTSPATYPVAAGPHLFAVTAANARGRAVYTDTARWAWTVEEGAPPQRTARHRPGAVPAATRSRARDGAAEALRTPAGRPRPGAWLLRDAARPGRARHARARARGRDGAAGGARQGARARHHRLVPARRRRGPRRARTARRPGRSVRRRRGPARPARGRRRARGRDRRARRSLRGRRPRPRPGGRHDGARRRRARRGAGVRAVPVRRPARRPAGSAGRCAVDVRRDLRSGHRRVQAAPAS